MGGTSKLRGIFATGLLTGALYLPLTLQLMLGASFLNKFVQALPFFFFPLCWAMVGLGFLFPREGPRRFMIEIACGILVFFSLSHYLPLQADNQPLLIARLLICWMPAAFVYLCVGRAMGGQLSNQGERVHLAYGLFLLGLVVGGVASDQLVPYLGGNGIFIVLVTVILAQLLPRPLSLALPVLALAAVLLGDLDLRLERSRNVGHYSEEAQVVDRSNITTTRQYLQNYSQVFDRVAWNRRGMTFMGWDSVSQSHYGVMNLQIEYTLPTKRAGKGRQFMHAQFEPGQDILLIGVGAGRSLLNIPEEIKGPNLVGVERDQNSIDLTLAQGLNPGLGQSQYTGGDGRAYVEKSGRLWDWIVIESALNRKTMRPVSLFQAETLFTPEALDTYLDHLKEGGTLVIEIHRFLWRQPRLNVLHAVADHLESKDPTRVQVIYVNKKGDQEADSALWVYARKGGAPLFPEMTGAARSLAGLKLQDLETSSCVQRFGDAAPFINWMCMRSENGVWLYLYSGLALVLFLLILLPAALTQKAGEGLGAVSWAAFSVQSMAHCFLFFAVSYKLRSVFLDDLATFYSFLYFSTFVSAWASLFLHARLKSGKVLKPLWVGLGILVSLGILYVSLNYNLLFSAALPVRLALFAGTVAPIYFFSTLLFHLMVRTADRRPRGLRIAFLCDSIAFLPAYAAVPWILFGSGIDTMLLCALAFFLLTFGCLTGPLVWRCLRKRSLESPNATVAS